MEDPAALSYGGDGRSMIVSSFEGALFGVVLKTPIFWGVVYSSQTNPCLPFLLV